MTRTINSSGHDILHSQPPNDAPFAGLLRRKLFGLDPAEATAHRRGFHVAKLAKQCHLDNIGRIFVHGYHAGLACEQAQLASTLSEVPLALRGFAFEGTAMALAIRDAITPWAAHRFSDFVNGAGKAHIYMAYVGAGWAWARLPHFLKPQLRHCDPLLRWLAIDGFGFHEGYFHPSRTVCEQFVPHRFRGAASAVFDQGVGRSLWFIEGADVGNIVTTIQSFDRVRRASLWSGIGLAATYAGGVDPCDLARLRDASSEHHYALGQGACFAAKARQTAHNQTPHTELACQTFCGLDTSQAAALTDRALQKLADEAKPQSCSIASRPGLAWYDYPSEFDTNYERWRRHVRTYLREAST